VNLAMAGVMHQPPIRAVLFAPAFLGNHLMHVQLLAIFQVLVTDWAAAVLPVDKLPATKRRPLRLRSSLLPVVLQGRIIGRIRRWHQTISHDLGPGTFPQRPPARCILQDPSALTT
jgi:hypothetical protein